MEVKFTFPGWVFIINYTIKYVTNYVLQALIQDLIFY